VNCRIGTLQYVAMKPVTAAARPEPSSSQPGARNDSRPKAT
jgi:hypothetical protein